MKEHFTKQNSLKDKGFSMVEIVVIIAIMIVLLAILTPFLLKYVENSRIQKDDSAMDEVCHGILYALSDSEIFDEAVSYSIPNNYVTYTDSSGVYAAKYVDEEFWAPDGSGEAVTITFNPDENGTYTLANGLVNDMTYGNGSVAETRVADGVKQCYFSEMGQQKLYHKVAQTIGETFSEKSATYKNSSYTVFITFDVVNGIKRADVYGEWNGTNLDENCPASLGSGTNSYTEDEEPEQTKTGGTTQSNYTSSDLQGSGGTSGNEPSYKQLLPCGHPVGTDGDHSLLDCEHYACEECGCVPAECGIEGHWSGDGRGPHGIKPDKCRSHRYSCQCTGPIVPEGGVYTAGKYTGYEGVVFQAGERLPCNYRHGDYSTLAIGDYIYRNCWGRTGWKVIINEAVTDRNQKTYGPILSDIFGEPVTYFENSFKDCPNLEYVPDAPDTVFQYYHAFQGCPSLKEVTLSPSTSTGGFYLTFLGCTALEKIYAPCTLKGKDIDEPRQCTINYYHVDSCDGKQCCLHNTGNSAEATCTTQAICADCGMAYGAVLPHKYEANANAQWEQNTSNDHQKAATCTDCGASGIVTEAHKFVADTNASCEAHDTTQHKTSAVCSVCGEDGYVYKSHRGGTATCTTLKQCIDCGIEYGSLASHRGGTATCQNKAICSQCNQEYGSFGSHVSSNGVCAVCGQTVIEINTPHNYANNQNYVVLGQWDYSSAKSVNITIEYETESTSWDWVSIVAGNDYVAGNSYNQTKNYLNTSGSIISSTGTNSSVKFGGRTRTTKTFTNVDMLQGTVVFRSDGSSTYWGAKVTITPNY